MQPAAGVEAVTPFDASAQGLAHAPCEAAAHAAEQRSRGGCIPEKTGVTFSSFVGDDI